MAAMFPLFVLAAKQNSGDAARNVALNIAQDRIEKIRQLDFDEITVLNLTKDPDDDEPFFAGQFGTEYKYTRNGSSKIYYIEYVVNDVTAGTAGSATVYKQVKVRVTWQGAPTPMKPVELKTVVYRQYSGPQIRTVGLDPVTVTPNLRICIPTDVRGRFENERWIDSGAAASSTQWIRVYLNPSDVPSMTGLDDKGNVIEGWVSLTITAPGGEPIESPPPLTTSVSTTAGTYYPFEWKWQVNKAPDAMYTITATAYSCKKAKGNTVQVRVRLETGAPSPPEIVSVVGSQAADGGGQAVLTWKEADLNILTYQVVRYDSDTDAEGTVLAGDVDDETTWLKGTSFTDEGITRGDTAVCYEVYAINERRTTGVRSLTPGPTSTGISPAHRHCPRAT